MKLIQRSISDVKLAEDQHRTKIYGVDWFLHQSKLPVQQLNTKNS